MPGFPRGVGRSGEGWRPARSFPYPVSFHSRRGLFGVSTESGEAHHPPNRQLSFSSTTFVGGSLKRSARPDSGEGRASLRRRSRWWLQTAVRNEPGRYSQRKTKSPFRVRREASGGAGRAAPRLQKGEAALRPRVARGYEALVAMVAAGAAEGLEVDLERQSEGEGEVGAQDQGDRLLAQAGDEVCGRRRQRRRASSCGTPGSASGWPRSPACRVLAVAIWLAGRALPTRPAPPPPRRSSSG